MKIFIDPDAMKKDYAASPAWLKTLMTAWADGLNFYLATHPAVKPRVLTRFEKLAVNFRDEIYPEAWGLEFEESFHVYRMLFFILLEYVASNIALLVWLFHQYGLGGSNSHSSVLWIVGWVTSLFGLTVTVWFKWAENRR